MSELKTSKYVVTELRPPAFRPGFTEEYAKFATRILWLDENVVPGAFQMNCSWYLRPSTHGAEAHTHDVDEIIGFFGSNPDDPYNLNGEVETWLEGDKYVIDRSALFFVPARMKHCPLIIHRVDRPIFHFSTVTGGRYVQTDNGDATPVSDTSKYIVTTLQEPEDKKKIAAEYAKFAKRILWLDENVVPGAFHMNTAWYLKPKTAELEPHTHDTDEIIGFFGSNPDDPYDLGGEVEIWLEDDQHIITRTAMIFVPAGMKHCPLLLRRVDRPIFHFTTVTGGRYDKR
jgi:quercetin dioxygenase-like cupin family protein